MLEGGASADSVRAGRWKLIVTSKPEASMRLFDLESDPGETADRSAAHPEIAAELSSFLAEWAESVPMKQPTLQEQGLNARQLEQLRSIGYMN